MNEINKTQSKAYVAPVTPTVPAQVQALPPAEVVDTIAKSQETMEEVSANNNPSIPEPKGSLDQAATKKLQENPLLADPMAAKMAITYQDIRRNLRKAERIEDETKSKHRTQTQEAGIKNAGLQRDVRKSEADKERVGAGMAFAGLVGGFGQLASSVKNRVNATEEAKNSAAGQKAKAAENDLNDYKAVLAVNAVEGPGEYDKLSTQDKAKTHERFNTEPALKNDKKYIEKNNEFLKCQAEEQAERRQILREKMDETQIKGGIFDNMKELTGNIIKSHISDSAAKISHEKDMNDQMIQIDRDMSQEASQKRNEISQLITEFDRFISDTSEKTARSSRFRG